MPASTGYSIASLPSIAWENGRSNHDEIFVDRAEQLQGLDCHVIYIVPISLVLSERNTDLMELYNCAAHGLPMITIRTRSNQLYPNGLVKLKEIIRERIYSIPALPTGISG